MAQTSRPLDRRRNRSAGAALASSAGWLTRGVGESSWACSTWAGTVAGLSGLELAVPVELFLDLNTSLKRPAGEGDLPDADEGGARPVLLDFDLKDGASERSVPSARAVAGLGGGPGSCCSAGRRSWRWSAWTSGDEVVK